MSNYVISYSWSLVIGNFTLKKYSIRPLYPLLITAMRQFSNILILLLLLLGIIACKTTESSSTGEAAQTQVKPNTGPTDEERLSLTRFDEAIAAFEAADKTAPPPANAFLFVGSSSIRKWETLAEDLAPLPVINRGFGGSTMPQLNHYADRIVFPYKPRGILVYEGDNDITVSSMTPEKVLRNVRSFFERVQKELPGNTRLVYCG